MALMGELPAGKFHTISTMELCQQNFKLPGSGNVIGMQNGVDLALNASAMWKTSIPSKLPGMERLPDLVEHPSGTCSVHTAKHDGSSNDRGLCQAHLYRYHHGLAKLTKHLKRFLGQDHKPETCVIDALCHRLQNDADSTWHMYPRWSA